MHPEDLRRDELIPLAAEACRRLHSARAVRDDFDMFEIQPALPGASSQERGLRLPDRYLDFEPQVAAIREALRARSPRSPCRATTTCWRRTSSLCDGAFRLIDYEYSGNAEPCFELGNVWSESNLSLEQLERLVGSYFGRPLRHKVARARLWGLMSKYGWTLWASIQDGVSDIDFDFWSWGMEKYERAVAEFDDPGFERLLDEARRPD